jgi:hypothetical protein
VWMMDRTLRGYASQICVQKTSACTHGLIEKEGEGNTFRITGAVKVE